METVIRSMEEEDYGEVYSLWRVIRGFGLRSLDDSREGVERFLRRNPGFSQVACAGGRVVGSILCGHDGRRGCLYHVCVHPDFRQRGIGKAMAQRALLALKEEGICSVSLIAFKDNQVGNAFWKTLGWEFRQDINCYDLKLNEENITAFNR